MPFNFPATPTVGQIYTPSAGINYVWTGGQWDRVAAPLNPIMPAGVYVPFAGTTAPPGTLFCDGKLYSRAAYPLLFAAIGITHGAGDGSTTFAVPDMRGRVPFGRDDMGGVAANRLTLSISGIASATLGAVGGSEYLHQHIHLVSGKSAGADADHTHYISGTSSLVSADHTHSGTTGGENVDHAHYVSVMTGDDSPDHSHSITGSNITNTAATGGNSRIQWSGSYSSGGASARHQHAVNVWSGGRNTGHVHAFTTGGISANHSHTVNFASGGQSVTHAHDISINSAQSGSGLSQNVPPAIIANYIIFTGA